MTKALTKKIPSKAGRKTKYRKDFPGRVEFMSRSGMIEVDMAAELGVSVKSFEKYKKEYPLFIQSLKRGKKTVDQIVVSKLLTRAIGYNFDEVVKERISDTGQKARHSGQAMTLTQREWSRALEFFGRCCAYCGARKKMTKDHVIPLIKGGGLTADNTVPACGLCNSSKKDLDVLEWYKFQEFYDSRKLLKITEYLDMIRREVVSSELTITKVTTKHVHPDVTAAIFWLKNRLPGEWREGHSGDGIGDQVTPELTQVINVLQVLREKDQSAYDTFVEVTTAKPTNGTARKKLPAKTKTKRRKP